VVSGGVPLLDSVLALLGTNRTRMQWKLRAWRRDWERTKARFANRTRALTYEHQTCPACSHPAGADERTCSRCGEPLGGRVAQKLRRVGGLVWASDQPVVASLLVAACTAMYLGTLMWSRQSELAPGMALEPHPLALVRFGSLVTAHVEEGEVWRLVTAMFLHVGVLHLVFNLLSLWSVASYLEDVLGKTKTFALYTALGIVASVTSYGWHGTIHSAGASGAICGLIGVAIGFASRRRNVARHLRGRYVGWAVWIVILGFSSWQIDNAAHVGGLVSGLAAGLLVRRKADTGARARRAWLVAALVALAVVLASVIAAAASGDVL
jgi:membrane associated rhomboid family serine protease